MDYSGLVGPEGEEGSVMRSLYDLEIYVDYRTTEEGRRMQHERLVKLATGEGRETTAGGRRVEKRRQVSEAVDDCPRGLGRSQHG